VSTGHYAVASMSKRYFTPELFGFLRELGDNNNREWFKANQAAYEKRIREPALDFITDFADPLSGISDHFVADSRTVGGSLFRIQRDTRFAKDKTPYKLNTGMHFRHERAKDAHAPGFYLHLEPGRCFMGVGLWHPESKIAYRIRHHIDEEPAAWNKATRSKPFDSAFELGGDSLKRPPRSFDPGHPLIEDLKRKSFMATTRVTQREVTSAAFMDLFEGHCRTASPLMAFLCEAVDVRY
jgi:uncharacterized protein (TIGR02453 family)